jgi:hypothetical protein
MKYDKIYVIYDMIYILLTAIGLTPDGSSTVHIYTQTAHRTTQSTQTTHRTTQSTQTTHRTTQFTNLEECGACPLFARYTLAFALQLRKKHGKTSARVDGECQLSSRKIPGYEQYIRKKLWKIWRCTNLVTYLLHGAESFLRS